MSKCLDTITDHLFTMATSKRYRILRAILFADVSQLGT